MNTLRVLVAILLVAACNRGDARGSDRGVQTTDSAGVQLVHSLDATVDTTSVRLVETLRIGNVDGPEELQFHQVTGVVSDSAGRLFVTDNGTRAVRLFDADGRLIRTFGGRGIGPGEFERGIASLFRWRDTIHAADIGRFSHSLFDTTGILLASFSTRLPNGSVLLPVAGGPRGWYFTDDSLFSRQGRDVPGTMTQASYLIVRLDPRLIAAATHSRVAADSLIAPVVRYPAGRVFWRLGSEGGPERFPLGNTPFFEPARSRAVDARGFVYVAAGWPYRIDVYDPTGALVRRMSRAHDSIPVADAMIDEILRRARAHYDTARAGNHMLESYEARAGFPRIGFVPVTGTLRVSPDGWLWVRRLDVDPDRVASEWTTGAPPRSSYWDVFDPDGHFQHTVRFPPRFTLYDVRPSEVIGVQRDELDVQYVVRYSWQAGRP
jgi:hypothetical protein